MMMEKAGLPPKTKYIFILSQRYSGSTLLSFLLATQPGISTMGERRKFYNKLMKSKSFRSHRAKICSCNETFENCPYLNTLKNRVLSQFNENKITSNTTEFDISSNKYIKRIGIEINQFFLLNQLPLWLNPFAGKLKSLLEFNRILVHEMLEMDKSTVFLDSSKAIKHVMYLSQIQEFDLSVVWLTRDPRAQVNSALKYNKSWDTTFAAKHWKQEMIENEKILNRLNIKHIKLPYENLCQSPKKEIRKILDFAGVTTGEIDLGFRKKEQHIIGNGNMRLGKEDKIVERKEWETELTAKQIEIIEKWTA